MTTPNGSSRRLLDAVRPQICAKRAATNQLCLWNASGDYTRNVAIYIARSSVGWLSRKAICRPHCSKKIQKRLVELKFLSGTADGIFGADTRAAIKSYQESIGHAQSNFLNAEERSMLLGPNAVPAQNASSAQTPTSTPEPSPEIASTPPATVQILQNTDDGSVPHPHIGRERRQTAPQSANQTWTCRPFVSLALRSADGEACLRLENCRQPPQ
jgi:hypothetical protein